MIKIPPSATYRYMVATNCTGQQVGIVSDGLVLNGIETILVLGNSEHYSTDDKKYKTDLWAISQMLHIARLFQPDAVYRIAYNPAHYATNIDLNTVVEYDDDGDICDIGGFGTPNTLCAVSISDTTDDDGEIIGECTATVVFELDQTVLEVINDKFSVH